MAQVSQTEHASSIARLQEHFACTNKLATRLLPFHPNSRGPYIKKRAGNQPAFQSVS